MSRPAEKTRTELSDAVVYLRIFGWKSNQNTDILIELAWGARTNLSLLYNGNENQINFALLNKVCQRWRLMDFRQKISDFNSNQTTAKMRK